MKAISVNPNSKELSWEELPTPTFTDDQVLVKVYATAVNRADLLQREGKYPVPKGASEILGLEASGIVEEIGANVRNFKAGDKVCCLLSGGGYAQYVSVSSSQLIRIPANLSFEQAAAIPEAFITAYLNCFIEGELKPSEVALIHAAASGVGLVAVQLAKAFGSRVFATAGTAEKCKFVEGLGAERCINYKEQDFLEMLGESSIDFILDMVGQKHLGKNLSALKYRGRLVMLSLISGAKTEINLVPFLRKNLILKGSTLRDRSELEKSQVISEVTDKVLPLIESGQIRPIIHRVFPIEQAQAAHDLVAADLNVGKVVLKIV